MMNLEMPNTAAEIVILPQKVVVHIDDRAN